MNRKVKDYSDPIYWRQIEKENIKLYERLQFIYEHGKANIPFNANYLFDHASKKARYQQDKIAENLIRQKIIHEGNLRFLANLAKVKATKSLCKNYLNETHWKNILIFKSRRFFSKNARIIIENRK